MEQHGEDTATAKAHAREEVERLAVLERNFFAHIGVKEYLCRIGKMPPCNAPNYYLLSRRGMSKFWITHVQTPPGYKNTDVPDFSDHIMYIRLRHNRSLLRKSEQHHLIQNAVADICWWLNW